MARRMTLDEARQVISRENTVTIEREESGWVARNKGNNHVLRRFVNGYDVVHHAMFIEQVGKPATEALRGDEAQAWWDARQEQNEKTHKACSMTALKTKMKMAEELLALSHDEREDYIRRTIVDCSELLSQA